MSVFHAGKQQIIGRAVRAIDIRKEKVEAPAHGDLLERVPFRLIDLLRRKINPVALESRRESARQPLRAGT